MANKSAKKQKSNFGLGRGRHTVRRKWRRRPKYKYTCSVDNKHQKQKHYKNKMKIIREKVLQKYNIMCKKRCKSVKNLFDCNDFQELYNVQMVLHDSGDNCNRLKLKFKRVTSTENEGYRLISLNMLQNFMTDITKHAITCKHLQLLPQGSPSLPPIKLLREVRTNGLASVLLCECEGCKEKFRFETSPRLPLQHSKHYDINVRSVWGSMVTGSGVSNLNEFMGTVNSPGMSQQTFSLIEQEIGDLWGDCVEEDLIQAGAEERRIAIEKGHYDDGVPCITVIADGGWSKRSHRHTYNALGGVGVIIGAETGKVLHIGVRNKHCYLCNKAETNHTTAPPHRCFRNWSESSQAMEADIILNGFLKAEDVHGLRYTSLIADGDSSVYAKIQENVPVWGKRVKKLECANHICKCLRTNLEKLVDENPHYKGKGKLSKAARVKIASAVRCAIRLRTGENNSKSAVTKLEKDIHNSVHHVFGDHQNCTDFCKVKNEKEEHTGATNNTNIAAEDHEATEESIPGVIEGVVNIWSETMDIDKEEESRGDCHIEDTLDSLMIRDISLLLNRVAAKSSRLIGNYTTNLAESWMAIRMKFDGGKLYSRCNRGSWHSRCYGGSLRKNLGPQWSTKIWEKVTSSKAGKYFEQLYHVRDRALSNTKLCQQKPERKRKRWQRKIQGAKEATSKKAKREYGPDAVEVIPEISQEKLDECKNRYMETHINLSHQKIKAIEILTKKQSATAVWREERKKRITSSNFGAIVRRNPKIKVEKLVKRLLYPTFKGNSNTRKGLNDEIMTIKEYELKKQEEKDPVTVERVGLIIHNDEKYLAASPDGRVKTSNGEFGLIEVKNLLQNKPITLYQAARGKDFCLELLNNELHLKRSHDYYFQVQGQLNICNLPWVDFVVRTEKPYQLHLERIEKDTNMWNNQMLPKLKAFYFKAVLPELAFPTVNTISGIREPGQWYTEVTPGRKKRNRCRKTPCEPIDDGHNSDEIQSADVSNQQLVTDTSSEKLECDKLTPQCNTQSVATYSQSRPKRLPKIKFVGRRISHEWLEGADNSSKWYCGTVTCVISGKDGNPGTTYEVEYDGEDEPFSIDHLYEDYQSSSLKFIDL